MTLVGGTEADAPASGNEGSIDITREVKVLDIGISREQPCPWEVAESISGYPCRSSPQGARQKPTCQSAAGNMKHGMNNPEATY
jgi:hypothetical protein